MGCLMTFQFESGHHPHIDNLKHNWTHAHAQRHVTPAKLLREKKKVKYACVNHLTFITPIIIFCAFAPTRTHILTDYSQMDFQMHFRPGCKMPVERRKRSMYEMECEHL